MTRPHQRSREAPPAWARSRQPARGLEGDDAAEAEAAQQIRPLTLETANLPGVGLGQLLDPGEGEGVRSD